MAFFPVCLLTTAIPFSLHAVINLTGPTTDWTAVTYEGTQSDFLDDEQTGINEYDIVGNATHPGIYTQFYNGGDDTSLTDGEIAFRFRLGGNKNPSYYEGYAWIGMDVNGDGALDLFAGAENPSASSWTVSIHDAGTGANVSPNTTSIVSASFYESSDVAGEFSWTPVTASNDPSATSFDLDSNDPDYFLSFKLDFAQLVGAVDTLMPGVNFDDTKPIAYVAATSTQVNSLNADLNGVNAGRSSELTWETLNAITEPLTADGSVYIVPEKANFTLTFSLLLAAALPLSRRLCRRQ